MAGYRIELTRSCAKGLDELPPRTAARLLEAIESLGANPRPRQCKKLTGSARSYRVRIGSYRLLYEVNDRNEVVIVYAAGHRSKIYKRYQ